MNSLEWTTAIASSQLRSTDRLVAFVLGHYGALKEACYPSHAAICAASGLGRQTVIRALARLEAAGFIHRTKGRTGKATFYKLMVPRGRVMDGTPGVPTVTGTCTNGNPPTKKLSGAETRSDEQRERQAIRAKQIAKLTANGLPVDESNLDEWVSMIELAGANGRKPGWAIETMAKAGSQTAREGRLAILSRVSDELRRERQGQGAHEQSSE